MLLSPGTRLGAYEIRSALGQGGMGEVYRARDTRLDRDVALKVLPRELATAPDRLARLEREAKAVAALNHPNLVTLHSIEEAEGTRFLTMELVEGDTLDRLVAPGGMPLPRLLELAIPLADALAAAHAKGIVHRDLKPSNVMVSREGRVKVLDFGLAKLAHDADAPAGASQATMQAPISAVGLVVGTVPYMAPEQLRGEPADARTDLFSLGVLLYELATGQRPFGGASSAEISSAILRDTPAPALALRADLPRDLDRVLGRCLEKDPERRVQTAKDVRNELELVRRSLSPASAPPAGAAPPPPPLSRPAAPAGPAKDAPSVAVLPFVNRSADPADEYFSDGLADELLSTLVKIRGLRVAARTSSGLFKGKAATIDEIGRALNVATVLEGSVRKAGPRVRISVQLVKVEDGSSLWAETYDRTLEDIFAVQDDIAQSVVKELRTTLLGQAGDSRASDAAHADVAAAAAGRGANPEAHRLYLQGAFFLERVSSEDTERAMGYLEHALALDPGNAQAWTALARAHSFLASYGGVDVREAQARARAALDRALALAPEHGEALMLLAQAQAFQDRDWHTAEATALRALALEPGNAMILTNVAQMFQYWGRSDEAERLLRQSIAIDPLSSRAHSALGGVLRCTGRSAEAEANYRKALELTPQRITCHFMLGELLSARGEDAAALAEVRLEPSEWGRLTGLSSVHWRAGRRAESDAALAELEAKYAKACAYQLAALQAERGNADEAFRWLDVADAERDLGLYLVMCEPLFRVLHDVPRWLPFLRKVGLVDESSRPRAT